MSQKLVYGLLKELGGTAFNYELVELAKRKYPDRSLHTYVHLQLGKLRKWGYVTRLQDGRWTILKELESQ